MQIAPSANLIAALSALTPATRPQAPQAATPQPAFAATVAGKSAAGSAPVAAQTTVAARPAAPVARTSTSETPAAGNPRRHTPLGRIIDIRV